MTNAKGQEENPVAVSVAREVAARHVDAKAALEEGLELLAKRIPCVKEVLTNQQEGKESGLLTPQPGSILEWRTSDGRRLGDVKHSELPALTEEASRQAEGHFQMAALASELQKMFVRKRSKKKFTQS